MKTVRIFLLVLIIIGIGLLATYRLWVPSLVAAIISHDQRYSVSAPIPQTPASTTTMAHTPEKKPPHAPKPAPVPAPAPQDSVVDITATIGPTCPVQQDPNPPQCADKPYQTTLVLASTQTGRNGGVIIKTDAQGHFSEDLPPGTYTVRAQSSDPLPRLEPKEFTIFANKRTAVALMFDSGIR